MLVMISILMLTQIYQCWLKFINVSTNTISMLVAKKKTDVREEEKPMLAKTDVNEKIQSVLEKNKSMLITRNQC